MTTAGISEPVWQGRRPRVAIAGPHRRLVDPETLAAIETSIRNEADIVRVDRSFSSDLATDELDFVVVLGGDGSVLRAARQMARNQQPVVGVNLGRLGFLASLPRDSLDEHFPAIARGECRIVHHVMFECSVYRSGQPIARALGLNETAILGGPPYSMLDIDLFVDGEWATTYSCDGLIVATPVGSTAHSLSAGGPILRKTISAFVISPISPHTLTVRPVVDEANRRYEMVVPTPHETTAVVVDGQVLSPLVAGDRVRVEAAPTTFQLIEVAGQSDYRTLRQKLGWHGSLPGRNAGQEPLG